MRVTAGDDNFQPIYNISKNFLEIHLEMHPRLCSFCHEVTRSPASYFWGYYSIESEKIQASLTAKVHGCGNPKFNSKYYVPKLSHNSCNFEKYVL